MHHKCCKWCEIVSIYFTMGIEEDYLPDEYDDVIKRFIKKINFPRTSQSFLGFIHTSFEKPVWQFSLS